MYINSIINAYSIVTILRTLKYFFQQKFKKKNFNLMHINAQFNHIYFNIFYENQTKMLNICSEIFIIRNYVAF